MSIRSFFVSRGRRPRPASESSPAAAARGARAVRAAACASLEALEERRLFATFTATADAFVRDGGTFANVNFGQSTLLFSKNAAGDTREAHVKFDVATAGTVGSAVLRVDARVQGEAAPDARVGIFAVGETGWVEGNGNTTNADGDGADADNNPAGELTFANRPAATGAPLDIIEVRGNEQQGYAFDVTNYVRAEKQAGRNVVAFVIRNLDAGADYVAYVSGEGGEFGPTLDVTSEAGPASAMTADDITTLPGGASHTVSVTYTDPENVEVLSISTDDLIVFGPNGAELSVSNATSATASSGSPLTVTYTIAAPGGSWDAADAGTYTVRLAAGQVTDVLENVAPPGVLGTFDVSGDGTTPPPPNGGPTAAFTGQNVTAAAATSTFAVRYEDADAVERDTIAAGNVTVTGPGGPLTVSGVTVAPNADGASLVATYTVQGPGGGWDAADNGTYTVALGANQVRDVGGNAAAAATLGTFNASIGDGGGGGGGTRTSVGTFGPGTANLRGLTFTDADGTAVTIGVKANATGEVFQDNNTYDVVLAGTSPASALSIKARGGSDGRVRIGDVDAPGGLRSITGKTADLAGAVNVGGAFGKLTMGNVLGGSLVVGGGGQVTVAVGDVTNFSIDSDSPIKSIKANNWIDDGAPDLVAAPSVGTVTVRGGYAADITTASLRNLNVRGAITGATIRSSGSVGKVTAGGMSGSALLVAVNGDALPTAATAFTDPAATLGGLNVKGTFSDTRVAAPNIRTASLGAVQTTNGGQPTGVAASTIRSVRASAGTLGGVRLSNLDDPAASVSDQDFVIRLV